MLGADDFIRRGALGGQALVQPHENGAHFRIQIAQTLHELNGKSSFERFFLEFAEDAGRRNHGLAAGAEKAIGEQVGGFASTAAEQQALGDPT